MLTRRSLCRVPLRQVWKGSRSVRKLDQPSGRSLSLPSVATFWAENPGTRVRDKGFWAKIFKFQQGAVRIWQRCSHMYLRLGQNLSCGIHERAFGIRSGGFSHLGQRPPQG